MLLALIAVLSLVPADLRPTTAAPHNLEHFALFAAAGAAFGLGYYRRRGLVMAALAAFAGTIELTQLAVAGRHARLEDFVVDALAVSASAAIAATVGRRKLRLDY